ncbi:hypothetical protein KC19_VG271000 [Ceratodon purpureus]|uniref:Uncharacterized protein n=1 Tax=Ceratodon purpureus TaxID=3225 RepID=A0A8T0HUA7_CERPU|nr:hypothetical protein KC19_VG271000 [Ceratodon purpureus]
MDLPPRVPLTDPRRIAAREQKLWSRESSYAIQEQQRQSEPHLKISCPSRLCNCGWRQEKFVDTVLHHLGAEKMYGRNPTRYGSSKGYIPDDSDVKWDDHITRSGLS